MAMNEDEPRPGASGAWVGLVTAAVIALVAIFGAHGASVWAITAGLHSAVSDALTGVGLGGLDVRMQGQRAELSGFLPSRADIPRAERAALAAAGPGGAWAGGVTSVDVTQIRVGAPVRPFSFRASRQGDRVLLQGHAPSLAARQAVLAQAQRLFPQPVVVLNEMTPAGGAPSPRWRAVAQDALAQLARLSSGEVRMVDGQVLILGEGPRAAVEAVRSHYETPLPAPFSARTDLTFSGQALAIPELQGINLTNAGVDECAAAFRRLMQDNVITFGSGSAVIGAESTPLLDNLARVALRCDRFMIEVAGHTDNVGPREFNLDLSRRRAEAVVAYLSGRNVAADRLSAVGFGPDRPMASNTTPEGQASNRRIVFTVRN